MVEIPSTLEDLKVAIARATVVEQHGEAAAAHLTKEDCLAGFALWRAFWQPYFPTLAALAERGIAEEAMQLGMAKSGISSDFINDDQFRRFLVGVQPRYMANLFTTVMQLEGTTIIGILTILKELCQEA